MIASKRQKAQAANPVVRCAIYTRKSTEEGLDQEFNSLDAQRESGEAYVRSQQSEGWEVINTLYDDGGFTGGNMDRPALRRLMADIEAGIIDCVVVYKVDRISRSLMDFSRIIETFDKHNVAFVSVTQDFNTANSMGRLMLNVLLSFAQFEREIISERTRDKIAAARRKGKWGGGVPVLGYDVDAATGKLVVNDVEATRVRAIFDLYRQHQSIITTVKDLDGRGWQTKKWVTKEGKSTGGKPFDKRYRYYNCTNAQKRGWDVCPTKSVPALEIEGFVVGQIRRIGKNPALIRETVREVNKQLNHAKIYEADVEKALAEFTPMWETLTNREQIRVMELLLKEVEYDGSTGNVVITLHPSGIQSLASHQEVIA